MLKTPAMQEFFSFGNQFYFYFVSVEWQGKIKAKISTQKSKKFSQTFLRFWVWATPTKTWLYTKCWGKERAYKINLKNFQKK